MRTDYNALIREQADLTQEMAAIKQYIESQYQPRETDLPGRDVPLQLNEVDDLMNQPAAAFLEPTLRQRWQFIQHRLAEITHALKTLNYFNPAPIRPKDTVTRLEDRNQWRTPNTQEQPVLSLVAAVFGGTIGLDPTADAHRSVPAQHHFTQVENCLERSWQDLGAVFMNPPFSHPHGFIHKLVMEYQLGHILEAIVIVKLGTLSNQGTGPLLHQNCSALCFWGAGAKCPYAPKGKVRRLAFLDSDGNQVFNADFDCGLVYFGNNIAGFAKVFGSYGAIHSPLEQAI